MAPCEVVLCDLLKTTVEEEPIIVHQCNCITQYGKGLSHEIFKKYPYANTYRLRTDISKRSVPGTIDVKKENNESRIIINLYGQYYPNVGKYKGDLAADRILYFQKGLEAIKAYCMLEHKQSLAFPYGIGCGLAGGNWQVYERMINDFANENKTIRVRLYKL